MPHEEVPLEPYRKFSTDELMELTAMFGISAGGLARIRDVLESEPVPPEATLFRYYNEDSRVERFEQEFREYVGVRYALGVNSCTSALIAALVAAGVGPGSEVIVPAYTFFASVSAVVVAKGIPVITEIDESLTLDPDAVEAAITERTRAIIAVHMMGHPARMDVLRRLADDKGLILIEDAAQAIGGLYRNQLLGSWGDLGCFSFDAYKSLATGEGGMITTNDEWLYTRAQSYHDTAACWRPNRYARERRPGELFCGENYRMPEMAGAIGLAQLRKIGGIVENQRFRYHQIRRETTLPTCADWVDPTDPEGVCGYKLALLFDTVENAKKAALADIGIGGMINGGIRGARDWHLYTFWEHILEQKTPTDAGCPFKCPLAGQLPPYDPDMCPRTKDIMYRVLFLDIPQTATAEWASWRADRLTRDLQSVFAEQ